MDPSRISITGPLVPFLEGFWSALLAQGYTRLSAANQARLMAHLSRWMKRKRLEPADLAPEVVDKFLRHRRRAGYTCWLSRRGLQPLLHHLEEVGDGPRLPETEGTVTATDGVLLPFEDYLRTERTLIPATVSAYTKTARRFLEDRLAGDDLDLSKLTATDVVGFVLEEARNKSVGTAKLQITSLRSFLRYLYVRGDISTDLAAAAPTVAGWRLTALPKALSHQDVRRLLRSCDRRTHVGRRNFAVLLLLSRLGLRRSEVAALELEDADWTRGELLVRGKGRQSDRLPLPDDVGKAVASYLRHSRPDVTIRPLFLCVRAPYRALGRSAVTAIVREACTRAGLPRVGAHRLRHTAATEMLRHGASLSEIAQVLRHRHLDTTGIYAKVDRIALRAVVQPWPGGAS